MTFASAPMTMPSVDCPAPYLPRPPRALVIDRIKKKFQRYDRHGQKCRERYNNAQRIIRENEKRGTAILLQRVQELKNKKGGKFKSDPSRQKSTPESGDGGDSGYPALALARLKRKLNLADDGPGGYGEGSGDSQDPKKLKHDIPGSHQRQEYPLSSVSVQIVQNFGNKPQERIETTVNVQSNGNLSDSQSVSVNVGSKNIKQETTPDNRRQQQQMNQGNNQARTPDGSDLDDILDNDMMTDGDLNMLLDWFQDFPEEEMDALLTSDSSIMSQSPQMTSQSQQMTSQSQMMTSQSQMMTSQSQQMSSQSHQMSSQTQMMSSHSQQMMSSQSQQMTSPPHMPSPGQQMTSSQSSQLQQQNARMLCKKEKVDFPGFHGNKTAENKSDNPNIPRNPHNMTQPNMSPHGMTQQNISANIMAQQSLRVNDFTAQQSVSLNMSSHQQTSFHGNPPPLPQQHGFHGNMPPSTGQQGGYHGNVPMSTGQQSGYRGNMRPSNNSTNNNNMTSQHIHKLNQVTVNSQFTPQGNHPEPPRLFHPPTNPQGSQQSQSSYYEHSQQLKQLAEKRGWEMNSSASVNMTSDMRTSQTFPQYQRNEPPATMTQQQMNMPSHPMSSAPGSQRLSHLDPNMYSRPQFAQNQRSGTVSIMMQQSMQMQHDTMMKQRAQMQMQERQTGFYNRMAESSHPPPHAMQQNFPPQSNGHNHPSWNPRGQPWGGSQQQGIPPQNPNIGGYNPELDPQSNEDLSILEEILSK